MATTITVIASALASATSIPDPYEGSWDKANEKYLLPNLVGLPYDKMIKNGEGARHGGDAKYYRLILVHGLFAAFAFLILIPAALICARFLVGGPRPRLAMAGHIGFQITSIIFLTISFTAGYFAVGSENWGKNPHHYIGAAVYAGMLFQAFFGAFVRWRRDSKIRKNIVPLHQMLHQWIGRGVFLLGLAQIPLGLYVYGSPLALFVTYAVCVGMFFIIWFICEYLRVRGWFAHGFDKGNPDGTIPDPEMAEHSEHPRSSIQHDDVQRRGDYESLATPKKSRFSKLSWLVNRRQSRGAGEFQTTGFRYGDHEGASIDTSRAASAIPSPAIDGLQPQPRHRQGDVPPVPSLPANMEQYDSSGSLGHHTPAKDAALRDTTTFGMPARPPQHLEMPEPRIPHSPHRPQHNQSFDNLGRPIQPFGSTTTGSGHSQSPYQQPYEMPPSPLIGSGYIEADNGFVPSPVDGAPAMPLPMRPHRRDRSTDTAASRAPIQQPQPIAGESSQRRQSESQPHIAVQVKLNPDKSVTVRRLPQEEAEQARRERERNQQEQARLREVDPQDPAEQARRERARNRQEQARVREMEIERERQRRRSNSGDRRPAGPRENTSRPTTSGSRHRESSRPNTSRQETSRQETSRQETARQETSLHDPSRQDSSRLEPWRQDSYDERSDVGSGIGSGIGQQYTPSIAPSIGAQSSTIAHASGGLLGRIPISDSPVSPITPPVPSGHTTSPLIGMTPVLPGIASAGHIRSSSQRASISSTPGTAENSEMEQEIVKEQRRKKRREERSAAGASQSNMSRQYFRDNGDPNVEWT